MKVGILRVFVGYFLRAAAQFITTVMGVVDGSSLWVLIRNRWPLRLGT